MVRSSIALSVVLAASSLFGQTPAPAHKAVPWKSYCQPDGGFCFRYPNSWSMLGEIFDGKGVVVAPAQKEDRAQWDEITVAMVAPPPQGDEQPLDLNGLIEQAAVGMREAGQNFQTLQRRQQTVDHKPAQMLKTQYREKAGDRDWIEELVFIEGPDSEFYSIALKCAPQNLARLEPLFSRILGSWTLPQPAPPADAADTDAPAQSAAPAKPSPPEAQPH